MKYIVTALEVMAAILSAIIAIILIVEHHTEWMLICTYWVTVAGRNIGGLFKREGLRHISNLKLETPDITCGT